ncbi:MAG: hypothetical protein ACC657_09640, partial [Thiohalomonadales bacterium]
METNNEAEPEKETVTENNTESKSVNATATKTESITEFKPAVESSLQRLTPAVIVSISILLGSGIISATSFAKSKDMAPQVRNFYYQLPPPGPYMSTLEMPRPPFTKNRPYNNQARPNYYPQQMTPPNWARPIPPWNQQPPGQPSGANQKSGPNTNPDKNHNADSQAMRQPNTPPKWAQHSQQMVPPAWRQRRQQMPPPAWA